MSKKIDNFVHSEASPRHTQETPSQLTRDGKSEVQQLSADQVQDYLNNSDLELCYSLSNLECYSDNESDQVVGKDLRLL